MRRFLVFAGERYYPNGGWLDFHGHFDDLEEAKLITDRVRAQLDASESDSGAWGYVVDSETTVILYGEVAWYQEQWAGVEVPTKPL